MEPVQLVVRATARLYQRITALFILSGAFVGLSFFLVYFLVNSSYLFPLFDGIDDWYVFLYVGTQFSGQMIDSAEGNLEWIDDDRLTDIPLWEGDYIFLPWLEGNRFFSAKFNYADGRYIDHTVTFH